MVPGVVHMAEVCLFRGKFGNMNQSGRIFSIFFLCSFYAAMCYTYAQSYNDVVEEAMDCVKKDSLVRAESLFLKALKMDPSNARNALLFSNLGTVQKRLGKTDEAIRSYTMALNIIPYSTAMLLNRAALYLELNLADKAYVDYCNVIDLLPDNVEARLFRAYIYMQRRQYQEARIDYNVVLGKEADNVTALLGMVMLDEKEGRYASARDRLNLLIQKNPGDFSLYKMRANLEWIQRNLDTALLDLEQAMKLNPRDAEIRLMKGDIYLEKKDKRKAEDAYEEAIVLGVSRAELHDRLEKCR